MKNSRGFSIIELLIVLAILGVVSVQLTTFFRSGFFAQGEVSQAKAYVVRVQTAVAAYTSSQWQNCVGITSVTTDDLINGGYLEEDPANLPYPTDINLITQTDKTGEDYARYAEVTLTIDDLATVKYIAKDTLFSRMTTDSANSNTITYRQALSPFSVSDKNNTYIKQQLNQNMLEKSCFDETLDD
ncbi:prepilin-type N-terminal cleavage/methylation domain-containing protein [Vibrio sp. S11_S32]|uniref:type II secretion system protein n=1 Tax=Vibrio sp. S11_S32 TaxID=2720225 RepID=UPI001681C0FC|nr:prepilin-type N-terminal cleavage/methylation domain-containing protein [Vibrio sp. S11_S32]MBD1577096.1 prepilin-type N-terminal cleavage/methylation domain-containing protein [Vibrio sp. S11_S32]